jgi:tetratricopeptide (TPR) repeat protein
MSQHLFVSYSSADGKDFSFRLAKDLGLPPAVPLWVDDLQLRPGEDWDEQIVEAIKNCKGMIFVMTKESVDPTSVCKNEWVRALKYKKPIIPLLARRDAELPFRLGSREYIDFTGPYDNALSRLREHCSWMDSPAGQLQALKHRLADGQRELRRAEPERQALIQEEIVELQRQIEQQQAIIDNPKAAEERVQQSIDRGLERAREPAKPVGGLSQSKFINPPPLVAPTWFQDRHVETKLIGDFLDDDALRLMTVVGRGGVGKSAMVCRLLRSIERGELPDDLGSLTVDGIVYLSDARQFHRVTVPDLYAGLTKLLPEETISRLDTVYKNPQVTTGETLQALTETFPTGRTVVLMDNFEDEIDIETGKIKHGELEEALRALLELPPHGLKVIITTRVAPVDLAQVQPASQQRVNLDTGLEYPFAENILRAMDVDGKVGLRDAPEALLSQARERTRGYPRALEHLFGILSADRDTSLQEILVDTEKLLPEKVVEVLVGEAFNRLDLIAQRVMQALATYRYPVSSAAVDYLLQPYVTGIDSGPVLGRLVNMQFVRREAGRYYLHQIDQDYALGRTPEGEPADRKAEVPPLTRFAMRHRAAEWFKLSRQPRETWKTLEDLAPQLAEFDLRCSGEDYDAAATVLIEISYGNLIRWGHYRLVVQLHERLLGKLSDPCLQQNSLGALASAYFRMAQYELAIKYYEQALHLAQAGKERWNEGVWLGSLQNSYAELGQIDQSILYLEQALAIRREVNDREGEAQDLGNLGNGYADIGQTARALDYYQQALVIVRELGSREGEAIHLSNLGLRYAEVGRTTEALQCLENALKIAKEINYRLIEAGCRTYLGNLYFSQDMFEKAAAQHQLAIEIVDEIGQIQFQNEARWRLALTQICRDDFAGARAMAEAARKYPFPMSNHKTSLTLAVAALRQGDRDAAQEAFATALSQAGELLTKTPQLYDAMDIQGLALCGLALYGNPQHIPEAKEAFKAARAINSDSGNIGRVLHLFDALAKDDKDGILTELRAEAAGVR